MNRRCKIGKIIPGAVEKTGTIGENRARFGKTPVTTSLGKLTLLHLVVFGGLALTVTRAHAQWWTAAPADFEDCAERAEKSGGSKDARETRLAACEAKFAGRRKPGGGYTYYDFMQNRSFDIAGPNPTAEEQKAIDEQYTLYLDNHRRSVILAAFAEKQREQQQAALAAAVQPPVAPVATARPVLLPKPRPRVKSPDCAAEPLACGWEKLSSGIKDLKETLFGSPARGATAKTKGT